MKKLLTLSALLLVYAALFVGCKHEPDPDALPGRWSKASSLSFYDPAAGSSYTRNGNTYTFESDNPDQVDSITDSTSRIYWQTPIRETVTGFKASIKKEKGIQNSNTAIGYGFIFNQNNDQYYALRFSNQYFCIQERDGNSYSYPTKWTSTQDGQDYVWVYNTNIYEEPSANEILVYADENLDIVINVNGETIFTIRNPKYKRGNVRAEAEYTYANKTSLDPDMKTVKVVTTFKEFQNAQ